MQARRRPARRRTQQASRLDLLRSVANPGLDLFVLRRVKLTPHRAPHQQSTTFTSAATTRAGFAAEIEATAKDNDPTDHTAYRSHKEALERYAFLLQWFVSAAEKLATSQAGDGALGPGGKRVSTSPICVYDLMLRMKRGGVTLRREADPSGVSQRRKRPRRRPRRARRRTSPGSTQFQRRSPSWPRRFG